MPDDDAQVFGSRPIMQWRFHPFHFAVSGNENEMVMRLDESFVDKICLKIFLLAQMSK